jgi:predicted ATP-binding protein involved in virulence
MSEETDSFESCVTGKMAEGMSREEAEAACRPKPAETKESKTIKINAENFQKTIQEAVAEALKGFKLELVEKSKEAVQEVRQELMSQTIQSVKKAITPQTKTPLYKEDLAAAFRELQLENAGSGKKSEIEGHVDAGGYAEQPGAMNDIRKKISDDWATLIKQHSSTAPKGA